MHRERGNCDTRTFIVVSLNGFLCGKNDFVEVNIFFDVIIHPKNFMVEFD